MRVSTLVPRALALGSGTAGGQQAMPDGETTFDVICASCHTIAPPHKTAPPMSHVVRRYRMAFTSDSCGI